MNDKYDDTNRGALFKNDKKEPGSKQPDYKGPINVDGVEKDIAAWLKTSKAGKKYMSISISEKFVPKGSHEEAAPPGDEDFNDEIPF